MPSSGHSPPPWSGIDEPSWIATVRAAFTERLGPRMEAVQEARQRLAEGNDLKGDTRTALFRSAHDISGTAASLGGERLGRVAGAVAERVDPRTPGSDTDDDRGADPPDLAALLDEFTEAAAEFLGWVSSPDGES